MTNKKHIKKFLRKKKSRCEPGSRHCVEIVASARLPSQFGDFRIFAFYNNYDNKEHVAIVKGSVKNRPGVPVRLHSECLTGDVLGSKRCDCREQLLTALDYLENRKNGVLLYMRQEGRGIGLINKLKSYYLQEHGFDTVEANLALGFPDDLRDYHIAADMLRLLGVKSIKLLTNNPKKMQGLEENEIRVTGRIPLEVKPNIHNKLYLETKKEKSGHMINMLK